MLENLSARTRQFVNRLVSGNSIHDAAAPIGTFNGEQRRLLALLASNLADLVGKSGAELAETVADLFRQTDADAVAARREVQDLDTHVEPHRWKIGKLRAESFRGLAPAGQEWSHDFGGESHLLYGPNGCGKSSLLGAIAWCLTGCIFRDDCPPGMPSDIDAYSVDSRPRRSGSHPDALTLLNADGDTAAATSSYWVAVQLLDRREQDQTREVWLRRHSADGLARSDDGDTWTPIRSITEVGISELDAELQLVVPATVPHIRFGENPDLVRLFAQIIGLDDLANVADLAGKSGSALRHRATRIQNNDLRTQENAIAETVAAIASEATDEVKVLTSYERAVTPTGTPEDVEPFEEETKQRIAEWKDRLANDLGLEEPDEGTPEHERFKTELQDLSRRVLGAVDTLKKPLHKLFPETVLETMPADDAHRSVVRSLAAFDCGARQQIRERLDWAVREATNPKAQLLLEAALHFPEGSNACPVCGQPLESVPQISDELAGLRPLITQPHLRKELADLARELISRLDEFVPARKRESAATMLHDRLLNDWKNLRESHFSGLLGTIADRFDPRIHALADEIVATPLRDRGFPTAGYDQGFAAVFVELDEAFKAARSHANLIISQRRYTTRLTRLLEKILTGTDHDDGTSLLVALRSGDAATKQLDSLEKVHQKVKALGKSQKTRRDLAARIADFRTIADATDPSKELAGLVRAETLRVFGLVAPRMQANYESMYQNEILEFDLLTPGHAANPAVKNQINVYLRAGSKRVPAGPFSNAGRLRALILAFVFALLEQSKRTLGLVVLDDPAFSLDDDHKARFVDNLVAAVIEDHQVILATHYERFYKDAETVFPEETRLQLPPRRSAKDGVAFEPADLLQRVQDALDRPDCSWRETGNNLRRWAERTLATLSGYCPEPFLLFNNVPGTLDAYERIGDPRVATPKRDRIVAAIKGAAFSRVLHKLAHDEEVTRTDVEDGLTAARECKKDVRQEIDRFKRLHNHRVRGRAVPAGLAMQPISLQDSLPELHVDIVARAAAATNGPGVSLIEHASFELSGYQAALVKTDALAPIALVGQYVLLEPEGALPSQSDLVIAEADEGERYTRRMWISDERVCLEAVDSTLPREPVILARGSCKARKIVGVIFDGPGASVQGDIGDEWAPASGRWSSVLSDVRGVRVDGNCMEPVARDGQIVLVRELDDPATLGDGDLACIDCDEIGAIVKRCFPGRSEWTLCPINPTEIREPIRVLRTAILHVYRLVGVLFEWNSEADSS